jgi:FkbM family methyltransferase
MTVKGVMHKFISKFIDGTMRYGMVRSVSGIGTLLTFKLKKPHEGTIRTVKDGIILNFLYPEQFMPTLAVFKDLVEPDYEYLRKVLNKRSVFFDVGGGIGTYSVLAAKIVDGPVHTFEPVSENMQSIMNNLRANGVEKKIRLNAMALSSREGFCQINRRSNLFGSNITDIHSNSGTGSVKVTTIDSYCRENSIDHIDLIKIDAEGHERKIIEGAKTMLVKQAISAIILETDHRIHEFYKSMQEMGFGVFYYDDRNDTMNRVNPICEETVKNLEPSAFSSNIVLVQERTSPVASDVRSSRVCG